MAFCSNFSGATGIQGKFEGVLFDVSRKRMHGIGGIRRFQREEARKLGGGSES